MAALAMRCGVEGTNIPRIERCPRREFSRSIGCRSDTGAEIARKPLACEIEVMDEFAAAA